MKKGFTLMEMLAVILVIAVVFSFAVPVLRMVRLEMKNSQARLAAQKLAEAVRSFHVDTHGGRVQEVCFLGELNSDGTNDVIKPTEGCGLDAKKAGVPHAPTAPVGPAQLFACGYLSYKDFARLPYNFCTKKKSPCNAACDTNTTGNPQVGNLFAVACGTENAGSKYQASKGCIYVDARMKAQDTY